MSDYTCVRCGLTDKTVLDLDTGSACHPELRDCIAWLRAQLAAAERERDQLINMAKCYYPTSWVDKPVAEWTIEDRANYVAGYWRFYHDAMEAKFNDAAADITTLRTRAERAEAVVEAADALVSYQGTDVEPQAWDTLNSALRAHHNGGPV
ncbi:hypothetical protein [Gemmatimonas sp.]|uniref:hypothetical protein n=1 Tax=Gemmatimonas sp. TaxID=1962908 RepID=UPI003342332E